MAYYDRNKFANLPKRPVKTFQDLDVYQQALEGNVFVANTIAASFCHPAADVVRPSGKQSRRNKNSTSAGAGLPKGKAISEAEREIKETIIKTMLVCSSAIPHQIAEAHSFRFGSQKECLILLEKVMLNCNKMVVYLDQTRDICRPVGQAGGTGLEIEKFTELQKKYLLIRRKVLNLQRAWQKYMRPDGAPNIN